MRDDLDTCNRIFWFQQGDPPWDMRCFPRASDRFAQEEEEMEAERDQILEDERLRTA